MNLLQLSHGGGHLDNEIHLGHLTVVGSNSSFPFFCMCMRRWRRQRDVPHQLTPHVQLHRRSILTLPAYSFVALAPMGLPSAVWTLLSRKCVPSLRCHYTSNFGCNIAKWCGNIQRGTWLRHSVNWCAQGLTMVVLARAIMTTILYHSHAAACSKID